jgi:hypothetical protein
MERTEVSELADSLQDLGSPELASWVRTTAVWDTDPTEEFEMFCKLWDQFPDEPQP